MKFFFGKSVLEVAVHRHFLVMKPQHISKSDDYSVDSDVGLSSWRMNSNKFHKRLLTTGPTHRYNKIFGYLCSNLSSTTNAFLQRNVTKHLNEQHGNINADCIKGFCKEGRLKEETSVLRLAQLLQACVDKHSVADGKIVHSIIKRRGYNQDNTFIGNHLLNMYVKCGSVRDACKLFENMPQRNICSSNIMITGYTKCGNIQFARQVFDEMHQRDVVSWTAIIAGYAQNRHEEEAIELFRQMLYAGMKPNQFTFASIMNACSCLGVFKRCLQVHAYIIHTGLESCESIGNALITMYANFGSIESAWQLFNRMPRRNMVSWNAMIAGYVKCKNIDLAHKLFDIMPERNMVSWTVMITGYEQLGYAVEAVITFHKMLGDGVIPDQFTFASVLSACATLLALEWGKQVHAHSIITSFEPDVFVGSALVDMYFKCDDTENAFQVFDKMPERNVVSWTAIIVGYVRKGHVHKAFRLFCQMQLDGVKPSEQTFASAISACAALEQGKQVHVQIVRSGFEDFTDVCNALLTMYAKSGSIDDAELIFKKMLERDKVSWTAMIVGYSQHGLGKEALKVFDDMISSGICPDHITFIGVLSACNHAGLIDEAREYFDSMIRNHQITPKVDHYACMVDLLARAGHLDEAKALIDTMPFEADALVWGALLGACRTYGNVELGKQIAQKLFEMQPENAATYILLSNIYAAAGKWDDAARVRKVMKDRRVKKDAGYSWIEVKNKLHTFVAGDRSHPQLKEITEMLRNLAWQMKEAGYLPDTSSLMQIEE